MMGSNEISVKPKPSIEFWVVLVIFFMGLLVRLYHLGAPSLSTDELYTEIRINIPFLDACFFKYSEFPPLHYAILNLWVSAFGNSEWALRFPSAIFSSLTIIVIYKLGAELFSKGVGLISAALLAFSPFALNYAQDAKMYAMFWFFTAMSFLFFFRVLKDHSKNFYIFYIISSILCCSTISTGFLFLMTQSIIFLLFGERTRWKKWFIGQLSIVSFCVPWVIFFLCFKYGHLNFRLPDATFSYLTFFMESLAWITGSYICGLGRINCFLFIFLIIYLLIDVLTFSYDNKKVGRPLTNYYCVFIWLIMPILLYFLFDYFFLRVSLAYRYIGFLQIPLILLVSSRINNFNELIKKILVSVMIFIAINSTYLYFRDNLKHPQEGWRRTAEELIQKLKRNDTVLSFIDLARLRYYFKTDAHRFIKISKKDCTSEVLIKKGILTQDVHSLFILYRGQEPVPEIMLNGFYSDYKFWNGGVGFLHFQRTH